MTHSPHPESLTGNELNRFKHLPHPEERCEAARLEGWATGKVRVSTLRDASLRDAPQGEVWGMLGSVVLARKGSSRRLEKPKSGRINETNEIDETNEAEVAPPGICLAVTLDGSMLRAICFRKSI
jgi:hypothetical protein